MSIRYEKNSKLGKKFYLHLELAPGIAVDQLIFDRVITCLTQLRPVTRFNLHVTYCIRCARHGDAKMAMTRKRGVPFVYIVGKTYLCVGY